MQHSSQEIIPRPVPLISNIRWWIWPKDNTELHQITDEVVSDTSGKMMQYLSCFAEFICMLHPKVLQNEGALPTHRMVFTIFKFLSCWRFCDQWYHEWLLHYFLTMKIKSKRNSELESVSKRREEKMWMRSNDWTFDPVHIFLTVQDRWKMW